MKASRLRHAACTNCKRHRQRYASDTCSRQEQSKNNSMIACSAVFRVQAACGWKHKGTTCRVGDRRRSGVGAAVLLVSLLMVVFVLVHLPHHLHPLWRRAQLDSYLRVWIARPLRGALAPCRLDHAHGFLANRFADVRRLVPRRRRRSALHGTGPGRRPAARTSALRIPSHSSTRHARWHRRRCRDALGIAHLDVVGGQRSAAVQVDRIAHRTGAPRGVGAREPPRR